MMTRIEFGDDDLELVFDAVKAALRYSPHGSLARERAREALEILRRAVEEDG